MLFDHSMYPAFTVGEATLKLQLAKLKATRYLKYPFE